jgi:hypothetical protein
MPEIPTDLKAKLEDRVREQIATEIRGDVFALYDFTLPAIRARRLAERNDEPGLSLSGIREFVNQVHSAEVRSIRVEQFHPSTQRFCGQPAAVVVTTIRYNESHNDSKFRSIWVYNEGTWITTALSKVALDTKS